ncbi:hypothetical protein SAMN04489859_10761, partial [Paracoccus alcaliphilus]
HAATDVDREDNHAAGRVVLKEPPLDATLAIR